jgi:hypothetical protein
MEKEFIPYEQALALKELGFDELCFTIFLREEFRGHIGLLPKGFPINSETNNIDIVSAPLYQQAFRWFREKYGLHRHICYFEDTIVWHGDIYNIKPGGLMNYPMELTNYNTYEETELECLKKLIEIVKQK